MKAHPDDPLFYSGVILLGGAAYATPLVFELTDRATAFWLAVAVMLIYLVGFTWVSNRAGADEINEDDEKEGV